MHLTSKEHHYDFKILDAVMEVNRLQKHILSQKIMDYFHGDLRGRRIAIWGLAFKPNTDDVREAPALDIITDLLNEGADMYDVLEDADALAIVTEWNEFRTPDFQHIKSKMKAPVIFDGRNIYDLEDIPADFFYSSIGREIIYPK